MMETLGVSIGEIAKKIAETASEVADAAKIVDTGMSFSEAENALKSMLKEKKSIKDIETHPLTDEEKANMKSGDSGNKQSKSTERRDIQEAPEDEKRKTGGSYGELKGQDGREGKEIHHIPAKDSSPLEINDGPAIEMDKDDHRQTASCGSSREAREYREHQKELIEQGKFREAFEMDVEDIREKFGDKYDDAIAEAEAYLDKLESEGKL